MLLIDPLSYKYFFVHQSQHYSLQLLWPSWAIIILLRPNLMLITYSFKILRFIIWLARFYPKHISILPIFSSFCLDSKNCYSENFRSLSWNYSLSYLIIWVSAVLNTKIWGSIYLGYYLSGDESKLYFALELRVEGSLLLASNYRGDDFVDIFWGSYLSYSSTLIYYFSF